MKSTSTNTSTPVYAPVVERLRKEIKNGQLKFGERICSEHGLVRETGMSRQSIRKAIDQLIAEGLVERRPGKGVFVRNSNVSMKIVQIIVGEMESQIWVDLVAGARELGHEKGIQLQVYNAKKDCAKSIQIIDNLPNSFADGAIITFSTPQLLESMIRLKIAGFPFVVADSFPGVDIPTISLDSYAGAYTVGQELLSRGHQRMAMIGGFGISSAPRERLEGFRDAINDAGLPFDNSLVAKFDPTFIKNPKNTRMPIKSAVEKILDRPDPPTAIFFVNDYEAAEGYRAIKEMGLRIPEDISVVGFDDHPLCRWLEPPLSSMRYDCHNNGRLIMEMLIRRMSDPQAKNCEHRRPKAEFVPRDSIMNISST